MKTSCSAGRHGHSPVLHVRRDSPLARSDTAVYVCVYQPRPWSKRGLRARSGAISTDGDAMFNLEPTEEQQLMVQTARELAKNEMDPKAHDADEAAALPAGFLAKSWELGIACPAIPEQYEGAAMERSALTGALSLAELGPGDLSMALALLAPASVAYPVLD